jgi:hypothetical protein
MSDIVTRLRDRAYSSKGKDTLCEEAADEIDRLREAVKLQALSPFSIDLDSMTIVSEEFTEDEDDQRIYVSTQHPLPD